MKRVCLVTGAAGRLGSALCQDLISADYRVIAAYHRAIPNLSSQLRWDIDPSIKGLRDTSRSENRVFCVQADLTSRHDISRLVEVSLAKFGQIDAIINSAADVQFHGRLVETWQFKDSVSAQLDLNCISPLMLTSAIHNLCWKDQTQENSDWNRVVINVSSISGLIVSRDVGQAFYGASKAALNMLTMYLALELAPYSVRANAICPAKFTDDTSQQFVVNAIRRLLESDVTGLVIQPAEIE